MTNTDIDKPVEKIQEAAQTAAHAETAPPRVRRYRIFLFQGGLLAVLITFSVLALLVSTTAYFPIDLSITRSLQEINLPIFAAIMTVISWAGYLPQSVLITVLIVVLFFGFGFHWEALMAMITAVLDESLNTLVKLFIHRPRPSANLVHVVTIINSYSFPSGHVMFYSGFFGFVWFLVYTLFKKSWKRTLLLTVLGILIVVIGISRIYLGEHWTSDVVGAYLLGILCLAAAIQAYRWGKPRFFTRQPVAAEHK